MQIGLQALRMAGTGAGFGLHGVGVAAAGFVAAKTISLVWQGVKEAAYLPRKHSGDTVGGYGRKAWNGVSYLSPAMAFDKVTKWTGLQACDDFANSLTGVRFSFDSYETNKTNNNVNAGVAKPTNVKKADHKERVQDYNGNYVSLLSHADYVDTGRVIATTLVISLGALTASSLLLGGLPTYMNTYCLNYVSGLQTATQLPEVAALFANTIRTYIPYVS